MINAIATTLAFRNRLLGVGAIVTTGSASIAATATGFTRTTGSFVTDGFANGMDVAGSGFSNAANNRNGVVTAVSASTLTVSMYVIVDNADGTQTVTRPATVVEAETTGRTISAGIPSRRAWEMTRFTPTAGVPFIEDEFVPATSQLVSVPASGGIVTETGLYVVKLYGLPAYGSSAIRRIADGMLARFTPGTPIVVSGAVVRVRSDTGTYAGQILPTDDGYAVVVLTVPWRADSTNTIAA